MEQGPPSSIDGCQTQPKLARGGYEKLKLQDLELTALWEPFRRCHPLSFFSQLTTHNGRGSSAKYEVVAKSDREEELNHMASLRINRVI
jgi:hypothetical protein